MGLVTIEYDTIIASTADAILFCIEKDSKYDRSTCNLADWNVWVPKSQIENHCIQDHVFDIPEWLAFEKDLI